MNKTILIVSAYGRGHWLAVQLKRLGLNVALMDVTEKIGTWIPEEIEGPFGFFYSDQILDSHIEFLHENDPLIESESGFTIWLNDGPVELKGITSKHRLDRLGINQVSIDYLLTGNGGNRIKSNAYTFSQKWLVHLAHYFSSNLDQSHLDSVYGEQFLPLFSTFSTRFSSRIGHEKSLNWVEREGIDIVRNANILDLSLRHSREVKGIEYKTAQTESSQVYECDLLIWNLTSEETGALGMQAKQALYSSGELEPVWYWARYRVRLSESEARNSLPTHCLIIQELGAHWTHENFLVLKKTESKELFDVWCRLPNIQRFNKDYLKMRSERLMRLLKEKIYHTEIEVVEYPIGFESTLASSGPARHPIFDPSEVKAWKPSGFSNVYHDSAEQWPLLGLNGMFEHQLKIFNQIHDWWKKLIQKEKNKNEGSNEIQT